MPITLTSAALHERFRSYSPKDAIGRPMAICTPIDQATGTSRVAYRVPNDKVLLVTHVLAQADDGYLLTAQATDSPPFSPSIARGIEAGSPGNTHLSAAFHAFRRQLAFFDPATGATTSWRGAQPGNVVSWKPRYPIPIGPGLEVRSTALIGDIGYATGAYGYLVDRDQAGALGFPVQNQGASADRRYVLGTSSGSAAAGTADTVFAGRTGRAIRILDIHIRLQPSVNTLTELELIQDDGTTQRTFFKIGSANPGDLMEMAFSPDIYLKEGADLKIKTTRTSECTVVISAEYVDARHIPMNHWWASVDPELPTPAVGGAYGPPGFQFFTKRGTQVTPYFPARDAVGSTTEGHQFVVQGYAFYAQQDTASSTDKLMFALSGGQAEGSIYSSVGQLPQQTNHQLGPIIEVSTHDQLAYGVVDDVCIPVDGDFGSPAATKAPGQIWVDSLGYGDGFDAPTATMNTIGWSVSLWGRMVGVMDRFLQNEGE